jgi:hypothetical protein
VSSFATNDVEAQVAKMIIWELEWAATRQRMLIYCESYGVSQGLSDNEELRIKWAAAFERIKGTLREISKDGYPAEDPELKARSAKDDRP